MSLVSVWAMTVLVKQQLLTEDQDPSDTQTTGRWLHPCWRSSGGCLRLKLQELGFHVTKASGADQPREETMHFSAKAMGILCKDAARFAAETCSHVLSQQRLPVRFRSGGGAVCLASHCTK